ncbi:MAG: hypothetical protein Kow0056_05670 [Coriobacteriia bacterium]
MDAQSQALFMLALVRSAGVLLFADLWWRKREGKYLLVLAGWVFATVSPLCGLVGGAVADMLWGLLAVLGTSYLVAGAYWFIALVGRSRVTKVLIPYSLAVAAVFVAAQQGLLGGVPASGLAPPLQAAILGVLAGYLVFRGKLLRKIARNAYWWLLAVVVGGVATAVVFALIFEDVRAAGGFAFSAAVSIFGLLFFVQLENELAAYELERSDARFRALFDAGTVGIALGDLRGCVYTANAEAAELLGLDASEVGGSPRDEGTDGVGPVLPLTPESIAEARASGACAPYEAEVQQPDGTSTPVLVSYVVLDRESERILALLLDISARKRMEAELEEHRNRLERLVDERTAQLEEAVSELREANERLIEAQTAKDRFMAAMSHELRTPLNSVIGLSGILMQELPGSLNDEQRKQVSMIHDSGKHLLALVNDILDFERIEAGRFEADVRPVDIAALVRSIVERARPLAEKKGLEMRLVAPDGASTVMTDQRMVEQIVWNLVGNALKFSEEGSVEVRLAVDRQTGVTIEVEDTGYGIPEEERERIFEEFERLHVASQSVGGAGLGLPLSRAYARKLGGDISVESEVGKGSVFRLELHEATVADAPESEDPDGSEESRD